MVKEGDDFGQDFMDGEGGTEAEIQRAAV